MSPISLAPKDAVAQYLAGGLTPAQGMPNGPQLKELFAASVADRFAWAREVAHEFALQLDPARHDGDPAGGGAPNKYALGDVGTDPDERITSEAFSYLAEVSQGFPYIGRWTFVRDASSPNATPDLPPVDAPEIVGVGRVTGEGGASPVSTVQVKHAEGFITHTAESLHDAVMKAVAWIEQVLHLGRHPS